MSITSPDSRTRPSSVSELTTFFEAQAVRSYNTQHQEEIRYQHEKDEVRCTSEKSDDINRLKDGHLVTDRRKLFENNPLGEISTKNGCAPIADQTVNATEAVPPDRHTEVTPPDENTEEVTPDENTEVTSLLNHPVEILRRSPEVINRHSLEDIQKVRKSVMDTIIKYIQDGISEDEDEEDTSTPPEMSDDEAEECESMIEQLQKSWSQLNCANLDLPVEGEEVEESLDEDTDNANSEIEKCMEEVSGEFNDLVALAEQRDVGEVQVRRSGNFLKNNRSSSKRKKMKKKTEDVVYSYQRFSSDDSTRTEIDCGTSQNDVRPFSDRSSFASSSAYESDEPEDIFGAMTEINEFIVEAYNNQLDNVLYKVTLQREPIFIPSLDEPKDSALDEQSSEPSSPCLNEENVHPDIQVEVKVDSQDVVLRDSAVYGELPPKYENIYVDHINKTNVEYVNVQNKNGYINPTYENLIIFNDSNQKQTYENWPLSGKTLEGLYYDKDLNPRITITCESSPELENKSLLEVPKRTDTQISSPSPKKQHIIDELRETERKYVDGLEYVIHEYLKHFMNHPNVKHVGVGIRKMFGNIEDIFRATENFYKKLLDCGHSVERISRLFLENEKLFLLCSDYMRNKSKTQHIYEQYNGALSERQRQLNDKKTCDSYLLSPVQRPTRYKLLLENLNKDLKKHGEHCLILEDAIAFIDKNVSEANRLLAIDSIRGCEIDLTSKGPLLLKDAFNIKRRYRGYIFLFRDVVIFASESKAKQDVFDYKDSIPSLDLSLKHQTNSNTFVLINFPRSKKETSKHDDIYSFEVEALTSQICLKWVNEIRNLLWVQLSTYKNLQSKKSLTENQNPINNEKFFHTLQTSDKKKKNSTTDSSRTSIFYISNDCQ